MIPDRTRAFGGKLEQTERHTSEALKPVARLTRWSVYAQAEPGSVRVAWGRAAAIPAAPWTLNPFDRTDDLVVVGYSGGPLGRSQLALSIRCELYATRPQHSDLRLESLAASEFAFMEQIAPDGGVTTWLVPPPAEVARALEDAIESVRSSTNLCEVHISVPGRGPEPDLDAVARALAKGWATRGRSGDQT